MRSYDMPSASIFYEAVFSLPDITYQTVFNKTEYRSMMEIYALSNSNLQISAIITITDTDFEVYKLKFNMAPFVDRGSVEPNNNTNIDNNNHRLMNDCRDGEGDRRD
ncbi:hypothetical protein F2P81_012350 [Scophthalmus maximus]|uniref:Uncharacterized protein n=1 Tax=Scophthalmus maximus TaxID=52904 RepID=A0A6A4SWZ6_SCOMX|nr:hypothetical protein F2P81_012350 [Scophthalmus maximus]